MQAKGVKVQVGGGLTELTPETYSSIIDVLQPDLYSSLVDEIAWEASRKRAGIAVSRSLQWLDDLLSRQRGSRDPAAPLGVLAPITGGSFLEERRRSAAEAARRDVAGEKVQSLCTS